MLSLCDIQPRLFANALWCVVLVLGCNNPVSIDESKNASQPETTNARPNILLLVADDMGYTDLGSFGSEIPTPNLDALAFDGVRFVNFHAAPSCAPTRAMLMSGLTGGEAGVTDTMAPVLSNDVAALPALLQDVGYRTYMAGKWYLGIEHDQSPTARGFDASFALVRGGDSHLGASHFAPETVAYRENGDLVQVPDDWFSSRLYTDKLIEMIRSGQDNRSPWFGYLAFTAPHWPLQAPADWRDRSADRYDGGYDLLRAGRINRARELGIIPDTTSVEDYVGLAPPWEDLDTEARQKNARAMELYAAMVENMDYHVGRLLEYLRTTNQFDNTVILFFSDNGASGSDSSFRPRMPWKPDLAWNNSLPNMGQAGSFVAIGRGWAEATTAPYRAVKGSLYEGGTRAAAFMHHESLLHGGNIDRGYLTVMDVLPTLLEIGGTSHPGTEFQGRSVLPIRGRSFWSRVQGQSEPVHGDNDVIPWISSSPRSQGPQAALVRGDWKIVREREPSGVPDAAPVWRLYHLATDLGETTDVAEQWPDLLEELITLWNVYEAGL